MFSIVIAIVYLLVAVWLVPELKRFWRLRPVSWAAHDMEPYAFQKHLGLKIAFVPLLIGSYAPDLMTKWFVYGIHLFGLDLKATNPVQFHRGWPGAGLHPFAPLRGRDRPDHLEGLRQQALGLELHARPWAHALTDTGDTVGTMLLFPWTHHFSIGAWAYAGQTGRLTDAAAYFSGLGSMWDLVWILYGLYSWRVLTTEYFDKIIFVADHRFWAVAAQAGPNGPDSALPRGVLLRMLALGRVDDLGARHPPLPVRPDLGRAALGARGAPVAV